MTHRLATTLLDESSTAHVVIHHDLSQCPLPPFASPRVHVVPDPVVTSRGNMTQVRAALRGIDWIRSHLVYGWIVLLSGQDYPILPLSHIEGTLQVAPVDAFLRVQSGEAATRHVGQRYLRRWYTVRIPWRRRKRLTFTRPYNLIFRNGFRCYKASTWWMLSRTAIDWVYEFLAQRPDYWRQYERTLMPDESFLQTAILNGPLRVHRDNMRYVHWGTPEARHPNLLTAKDFPAIVASPHWFARKFNSRVDAVVLDRLDDHRRRWTATRSRSPGAEPGR